MTPAPEEGCCSATPPTEISSPNPNPGSPNDEKETGRYLPLMVLIALTLLAAGAKQIHYGEWNLRLAMHDFMGLFLLCFSMLKLFDLGGFAAGFRKYDLLASRLPSYACIYPFLELALALGYLSRWQPTVVYFGTVALMGFGAIGVFRALMAKQNLNCACMGSSLNVPLSTVAVVENVGMAGMALLMLLL